MMRLFFTLILLSLNSYALQFEDAARPELMPSGRALALGNAYIARANDNAAPFYNPAGLGSVRKLSFQLSNVFLETNKGFVDTITGHNIETFFDKILSGFKIDSIRESLAENGDKPVHLRFAASPNITFQYFSLGYMANKQLRAVVNGNKLEYGDRFDHGPYVSLAIPFFGGIGKIGATGVFLSRTEAIADTDLNTSFEIPDSEYTTGTMTNLILGGKLTIPVAGLPTFAVTYHNAGKAKMKLDKEDSGFTKIESSLAYGFSFSPKIGRRADMNIEINYRDPEKKYGDIDELRKVSAGIEFSFARQFFIRLGLSDGFGSFGLGIKSSAFMLDLTTYAVDTADSGFRQEEDRRVVLGFSIGG